MKRINFRTVQIFSWTVFLIFTSIAFAQNDSTSSQINLKTILEDENVPLNQEVVYHVELSWQGDLDRYKINDILDPVVSNLALRGSGSSNRLVTDEAGNPKSIRRVTYYFKGVEIGMAYIDGLTIQYLDTQLNKNETLIAQRIGIKIGPAIAGDDEEFMPGTIVLWLLLAGFILALGYFLMRFIQRRKLNELEEVEITLEEKYLNLQKDTIHIANGATNENISLLKKLLTSYISERFSISDNIDLAIVIERLNQLEMPQEMIDKIETLYSKAELASFAGEKIDISDLHMFYDTIEQVLTFSKNKGTKSQENQE